MFLKYFSKATNNKLTRKNTKKNQICFIYKNRKTAILNKNQDHKIKTFNSTPYMMNSHEQRKFKTRKGMDQLSQYSTHPSTFMRTNQRYQLLAENLPTLPS
jgi:hypothetical protein